MIKAPVQPRIDVRNQRNQAQLRVIKAPVEPRVDVRNQRNQAQLRVIKAPVEPRVDVRAPPEVDGIDVYHARAGDGGGGGDGEVLDLEEQRDLM